MAARVYMSGATRVFKWNVERLSSKQCPHHPYQVCGCSYQPVAGVILIQYATFPGGAQTIVTVSNPIQHLRFFEHFKDTKRLLGHILQHLPFLGSCKNIDECAEELAQDLSSQFHFRFGLPDHIRETIVLLLNLEVEVEVEENHDVSKGEWTLKNAEGIEAFLTRRCPLIWAEAPKGLEEVIEITKVDDDDQDKKNDEEYEECPIYLGHEEKYVARSSNLCPMFILMLFMFILSMFHLFKGSIDTSKFLF